ncbi:hypothetical protein KTG15_01260 [Methanobacterium sp. YSL]|nr:hypothetical protein [Methanobacterium sp. YSL]
MTYLLSRNRLQEVIIMGALQERLDIFQEETRTAYQDIMKILEDKYCWKCPMRSTSTNSRCREVHAGRVLQEAMDQGIYNNLQSKIPRVEVNALIARIQKKRIKKQGGAQREKKIIIQVKGDQNPNFNHDEWLVVKINPKRIVKGDKILIPYETLAKPLLGAYALIAGFPSQIAIANRVFHEGNFWYVEVGEKEIVPLESVLGVLVNVLREGNSI